MKTRLCENGDERTERSEIRMCENGDRKNKESGNVALEAEWREV